MKKIISILIISAFAVGFLHQPAFSAVNLVTTTGSSTVYYLDDAGYRHAFPNLITYQSWYGNDFSKIVTVSRDFLATYPLGKNIVIKSGKHLVKIPTAPQVYAVEPGGLLRHVENSELAESIYGLNWQKKVVDIPEVFFENYIIGESIKHYWDIPEGVVYKIQDESRYYWKENDFIRPFESVQAMEANGYNLSDVITATNTYYTLLKPIAGFSSQVSDLVQDPFKDNADCESKKLKAGFLFIHKGGFTSEELQKINTIKDNLSSYYSWATDELSQIDVRNPVMIISDDGYLVRSEEGVDKLVKDEISQVFYAENQDAYDFLIMFTNFEVFTTEIADFLHVENRVSGLGKAMIHSSTVYGSSGKLKGIINMGDINKHEVSVTSELNKVRNYLLHEILHNWSAQVKFVDANGAKKSTLLRDPDFVHWSYYDGFVSPLGGSGWQDNGDGTFTSATSQMTDSSLKKYADIDLYLMGLIPAREVEPVMYLVPKTSGALGNTIEATAQYVDIEQIIEANGEWQCMP